MRRAPTAAPAADPAPSRTATETTLRVAAAPSGHPLAGALAADPRLAAPLAGPALPSAARLRADALPPMLDDVDVVHLHGGVERCDPAQLEALLAALHARDVAVVASLGELRARDEVDRGVHDARLEVLLRGADACTTITRSAATEVRERFGVEAIVVPYLGVVPDARIAACMPRGLAHPVVGLGVTRLDARTALVPAVEALGDLLESDPHVRVQVHVHEQLGDAADDVLAPLVRHERVAARFGGWMPDDRLYDWVEQLDVLLLPHRWSTHSAWVGLARDLGTATVGVAAPSMRELGLSCGYVVEGDDPTPRAMGEALCVALALAAVERPAPRCRREQLEAVRDAHTTLYGLVAGRRPA